MCVHNGHPGCSVPIPVLVPFHWSLPQSAFFWAMLCLAAQSLTCVLLKLIGTPKPRLMVGLCGPAFFRVACCWFGQFLHLISGCYTPFSKLLEGCLPRRDGGRRRVLGMVWAGCHLSQGLGGVTGWTTGLLMQDVSNLKELSWCRAIGEWVRGDWSCCHGEPKLTPGSAEVQLMWQEEEFQAFGSVGWQGSRWGSSISSSSRLV